MGFGRGDSAVVKAIPLGTSSYRTFWGCGAAKHFATTREYVIRCGAQDDKTVWRQDLKPLAGIAFGPAMLIFKLP
jgi:hypothetical protein